MKCWSEWKVWWQRHGDNPGFKVSVFQSLKVNPLHGNVETLKLETCGLQFSVGSTFSLGAGKALPAFGGSGGLGGVELALRISMPSCSLLSTMWDEAFPTLPLALASCSSLFTFNSEKSD